MRLIDTEIKTYNLNRDDLVINRVNSRPYLGKILLIEVLSEATVFESNMMRFSVDKGRVDPIFLSHQLQTPFVVRQIQSAAKDAVNQASINQEDVRSFEVRLPPLQIQWRFARLVDRYERLRAIHFEVLRQADHLFQTLLHQAFTPR